MNSFLGRKSASFVRILLVGSIAVVRWGVYRVAWRCIARGGSLIVDRLVRPLAPLILVPIGHVGVSSGGPKQTDRDREEGAKRCRWYVLVSVWIQ